MLPSAASKLSLLVLAPLAAVLLAAPAAGAQTRRPVARASAPKPLLDVRDAQRRAVARRHGVSLRAPSARTRSARSRLRAAGAVVGIDALTGTPRFLLGRAAPLSRPATGASRDVADRYVRTNLATLGLSRTDLGSLRLERRITIPGRAEQLTYRQYADGIPSFDGGLRIVVDAAGRVVTVSGAPQPSLRVAGVVPTLTAAQAMRRLMDNVGVHRPPGPASKSATLVVFAEGTSARLAWQLVLRAGPAADYVAVVDAATGRILYRANRVKAAANDALVWEQYPGAANGGTAQTRDLTPYLNPGATDLSGPYAHAWSDTNDNDSGTTSSDGHIVPRDQPDAGEAVTRTGSFSFVFDEFTAAENPDGACNSAHRCSWDSDDRSSWTGNRAQNAVQAFYYVNRFHDHLLAPPISFTPADGNFETGDRLLVNTDDGADTGAGGGPDNNHVDNAYMDTPPDGTSPTMAMFLFENNGDFRDVNGGDDAAVVYHEYTHGLSGRLITFSDGEEALNRAQSGGMGEGWSDWYAKDFLVGQFPSDDTATAGDVDMGKYIDSAPHTIRSQGLDCPVGADGAQCPAGLSPTHFGGYTYGDFNTMDIDPFTGGREVHEVGEIWGETLWDLRAAVGSGVARAIITQGMRFSPTEPTLLDERDAILTADSQLFRDADHSGQIWQVFANRGMGWDASDGGAAQDVTVQEGFKRPPTAGLAVSPSPASQGQPVTVDASSSNDPDGQVTSYDFDFQGDGVNEINGTSNPRQTFTYSTMGTFHPTVTVHDNEGQSDKAARALQVGPGATPTPTPTPTPTVTPPPSRPPTIVLAGKGKRGRVRLTVRCDSVCAGTATLTITRKLARKLHLKSRRVGRVRIRLVAAGQKRFTIRLNRKTRTALRRAGQRRIVTRFSAAVTDAEHQRTAKRRRARIRR